MTGERTAVAPRAEPATTAAGDQLGDHEAPIGPKTARADQEDGEALWPEDRQETLLPAESFGDEPAGERFARLLRLNEPATPRDPTARPSRSGWGAAARDGPGRRRAGSSTRPSGRSGRRAGRERFWTRGPTRPTGRRSCRHGPSTPTPCVSWSRRCAGTASGGAGSRGASTAGQRCALTSGPLMWYGAIGPCVWPPGLGGCRGTFVPRPSDACRAGAGKSRSR